MNLLIHDLVGGSAPIGMKDERRRKCVSGQHERHPPQLPAESQHRPPANSSRSAGHIRRSAAGNPNACIYATVEAGWASFSYPDHKKSKASPKRPITSAQLDSEAGVDFIATGLRRDSLVMLSPGSDGM